jgi:peptidyl-prolyl cis-trans isomerase B (cyclophilin B)
MKFTLTLIFTVLLALVAIMGCTPEESTQVTDTTTIETPVEEPEVVEEVIEGPVVDRSSLSELMQELTAPPKEGEEVAVLDTSQGRIVLRFWPDIAPGHVDNFKKLAAKGFYDGTRFHRVIPGFMIQGGDPTSKDKANRATMGTGGPGYTIEAEFNDEVKHIPGVLSMARTNLPDTAGSQFFIVHGDAGFLDGQYTAFGYTVEGLDVVEKIVRLERDGNDNPRDMDANVIESVTITKWPVKD